jgi:hypothetical protein
MKLRGAGNGSEPATTGGAHAMLHTILESPDVLAAVNNELAQRNHQAITYGALRSGLALHYLCHALQMDTGIYCRLNGTEYKAVSVSQRRDSIGRMDTALVFDVEPA